MLTCLALAPGLARAQGTARSMDLDPSVLSSGMGGASTAVWWSAEPNYWANPALLGYYRGFRWQWGKTNLVPDATTGVEFETNRFTLGGGGVGFEFAGHPIDGMGSLHVDYGDQIVTDAGGNPIGVTGGHETIEASGGGVSLEQLTASVLGFTGRSMPPLLRHVDAAFGYARKFTEVALDPSATASAVSHDYGWLVKGGFGGYYTANDDAGPLSLEGGYGRAVLNYDDASFVFPPGPPGYPPSRMNREGGSARLVLGSTGGRNPASNPMFSALMRGFAPLATVGFGYDRTHISAGGSPPSYQLTQWGAEATFVNVLTLRFGHVRDVLGDIDGDSYGLGVAVPVTEYAGARYDYAKYPRATGTEKVTRQSISVWLNPIALHRALQSGS
jgi:hypothetical protein